MSTPTASVPAHSMATTAVVAAAVVVEFVTVAMLLYNSYVSNFSLAVVADANDTDGGQPFINNNLLIIITIIKFI